MQSQNTCLHAWKSATNKQFNGQGFTAPPTSPELKESGGRLKGERLHLMEKLQFPILAASPLHAVRYKARLCLHVPQKPVTTGERLQVAPETWLQPQVYALASPGNPLRRGPMAACGPKGYAFQPLQRSLHLDA